MENNSLLTKVMGFVNKIGHAVMMNLLFLLGCLPIVTIGPSWCGLMSAVRYEIRGEKWHSGFFAGFRTRFVRSAIVGLVGYAVTFYLANNAYAGVCAIIDGAGGWFSTVVTFVLLVASDLMMVAMLALNVYIPTDVDTWIDNAVFMIKNAPLQVLLVAVIMWLPIALAVFDSMLFMFLIMVFVAAYFTVAGVVMTALLKNVLIKVLQKERAKTAARSNNEESA